MIASPEATAAETSVTSSTLVVAGLRLLPAAASEVVLVSKNCKMKNIAAQLPKMTLTRRVFRIMISFKFGSRVYIMFNSSNFCGCRGFIEDVRQCSMALHT